MLLNVPWYIWDFVEGPCWGAAHYTKENRRWIVVALSRATHCLAWTATMKKQMIEVSEAPKWHIRYRGQSLASLAFAIYVSLLDLTSVI